MPDDEVFRFAGPFPALVVFDFDGVLTDNGVWVGADGSEFVRCDRSDGLGIDMLRLAGVEMLILSTERNPVVQARAEKLNVPVEQGVDDKGSRLCEILSLRGIEPKDVVYLGNDVNDAKCLELVGNAVVVADSHPDVLPLADLVLSRCGGHGAARELCDLLLQRASKVV